MACVSSIKMCTILAVGQSFSRPTHLSEAASVEADSKAGVLAESETTGKSGTDLSRFCRAAKVS